MPLTDYAIAGVPDIAPDRFRAILADAKSPALPEAAGMHTALVAAGVSPACFLAFFQHESRFGLLGICKEFDTRNPGNVRSPERADTGAVIVQTPRGPFAKYPNWTVATKDWAARLRGPKYEGAGLRTVRQVLPKYAPPADSNDPDAYARAVLGSVERWTKEGGKPVVQLTMRVNLLRPDAPNNPNRPLWGGRPKWITVHETDNYATGANAAMHERYVHGPEAGGGASYHAVVDDKESIQLLPWTNAGYHIGDGDGGEGNNTSIGFEICVNKGCNFRVSIDRAARLTAALLQAFDLPPERVRRHGDWWKPGSRVHKYCPQNLIENRQGINWDQFMALVRKKHAAAEAPTPPPPAPPPPPPFAIPAFSPPSRPDRLGPNEGLRPGQSITAADGETMLILQEDGNVVVYGPQGPIWDTGTVGSPSRALIMQGDGNLVVYTASGPVYDTATYGRPGAFLVQQDDGNTVLYHPAWASYRFG